MGSSQHEYNKIFVSHIIPYCVPGSIFLILFFLTDIQFLGCNIFHEFKINFFLKQCSTLTLPEAIFGLIFLIVIPYFIGLFLSLFIDIVFTIFSCNNKLNFIPDHAIVSSICTLMRNMCLVFILISLLISVAMLNYQFNWVNPGNDCGKYFQQATCSSGDKDNGNKKPDQYEIKKPYMGIILLIIYIILAIFSWVGVKLSNDRKRLNQNTREKR